MYLFVSFFFLPLDVLLSQWRLISLKWRWMNTEMTLYCRQMIANLISGVQLSSLFSSCCLVQLVTVSWSPCLRNNRWKARGLAPVPSRLVCGDCSFWTPPCNVSASSFVRQTCALYHWDGQEDVHRSIITIKVFTVTLYSNCRSQKKCRKCFNMDFVGGNTLIANKLKDLLV